MDPNEMAHKLLNQDPFHEVRRKRDNKKEIEYAANMGIIDDKRPIRRNTQWAKPPASWNRNAREGHYSRNAVPDAGIKEFRIVRDNRANQNANCNAKPEASQDPASGGQEVLSSVSGKNDTKILDGHKPSAARNPEVHTGPGYVRDVDLNGIHNSLLLQGTQPTVLVSTSHSPKEVQNNSRVHSEATSTNYVIGLYPSSSDPVHVPSPDSRSGGKVGAIRREVGVVGVPRRSSNGVPNNSSSFPSSKKDTQSAESFGDTVSMSNKNNQLNQTPASEHVHNMSTSKPFSSGQNNNKLHQQFMSHQKASEPNMEWKPKSSKKVSTVSPVLFGTISAPFSSSIADSSRSSKVDVAALSEKLEHVNIMENQHVLIPKHFRVPESERTWLKFGSFGVGFDSTKSFISLQTTENSNLLKDEPNISTSASVPVGPCEDGSTSGQGEFEDQTITSLSESPTSSGTHQPPTGNESFSPKIIESYEDIGLLQSHSPPYGAPEQLQESPCLPGFSAYDTQTSYDSPFFRTVMGDNVCGQGLASPSEALGLHADATITGSPSPVSLTHQQQPIAQMYSQVQISQIPNFLPYRHIFSPVYIPPVAIQNYPSNPSYPHPSNGSNYLLMPGGSSHLIASGVKYGAPQYKQVPSGGPAGYGNYNSSGFTISTPASIGGITGLEDVSRIKYKDNLYVPNPQAESSDIWIQTPRELPGLQSAAAPYYNLTGPPPHAAFMPAHTSHAPFSAAEPHAQYPGLYQSQQQPASISDSHHLVQQPINPGFAPNPQLGTFQQSQMSHFNWNFNV